MLQAGARRKVFMALAGFFEPRLIGRTIIIILRAATLRRSSQYLVPYLPSRAVSQNQCFKTEFSGSSRADEKKFMKNLPKIPEPIEVIDHF
jgi:hypothetical protein